MADNKDDDEISIDFSKVKNFFRKHKSGVKKESKDSSDEEDIAVDWKDVGGFFKKYGVVFLLLVPLFFSIFFRMYPVYLPITDDWAKNNVYSYYQNQIGSEIDKQYPNLPSENRKSLIDTKFAEFLKTNKVSMDETIKTVSNQFKSQFKYIGADGKEHMYITDIDSYYWLMYADWFIKYGYWGNALKDGKSWDYLHNGREGRPGSFQFQPLMIVIVYKIMSFFNKGVDAMDAALFMPVILMALAIFPAFFIGRKIAGNFGGLATALAVAVIPASISRTMSADTDSLNILFPLLIMWFLIEAIEGKDLKKKVIFSLLTGFVTGIYAFAWSGWQYTTIIILAYLISDSIFRIVYNLIVHKKFNFGLLKNNGIIGGIYLVSASVFAFLFSGSNLISGVISLPAGIINMKDVAAVKIWPNVLTTVAEFNVVPVNDIISQMGGNLFFWIGLMGIIFLLVDRKKMNGANLAYLLISGFYYAGVISVKSSFNNPIILMVVLAIPIVFGMFKMIYFKEEHIDIGLAIILIIWFMSVTYGFTKGVRFAILMVAAFAIAFGVSIGFIYRFTKEWVSKELNIDKLIVNITFIALFILLFSSSMIYAHETAKSQIPYVNDAWYNSLIGIKNNSTDAIITSWWDFGHWFTEIAQRRVTFDGANQGERIHWVGKSLLTSDEDVSVGILRMMNCGHEKAPHVIEKYVDNDTVKAIDILNRIIVVDKDNASEILKSEGFSDSAVKDVLNITHCDDLIPQYFITSEDMVGKAAVWAHFGSWDFRRAEMYQSVVNKQHNEGVNILKDKFNLSDSEAETYYNEIQSTGADQWISPWPSYFGVSCNQKSNIFECMVQVGSQQIPVTIDVLTMEAYIKSDTKKIYPASIVYADKKGLKKKVYDNDTIPISIAVIPKGNSYSVIASDPLLIDSMFTRLFYFNGHGSSHFKKFSDVTSVTGERIIVWTVDWESDKINVLDELKDKYDVDYIGWLNNGTVFDSSIKDWRNLNITKNSNLSAFDNNVLTFTLGNNQLIKGFEDAVVGMGINDTKTIKIKPEDAYGTDPAAHPLGNQTLNFKIMVVDIK